MDIASVIGFERAAPVASDKSVKAGSAEPGAGDGADFDAVYEEAQRDLSERAQHSAGEPSEGRKARRGDKHASGAKAEDIPAEAGAGSAPDTAKEPETVGGTLAETPEQRRGEKGEAVLQAAPAAQGLAVAAPQDPKSDKAAGPSGSGGSDGFTVAEAPAAPVSETGLDAQTASPTDRGAAARASERSLPVLPDQAAERAVEVVASNPAAKHAAESASSAEPQVERPEAAPAAEGARSGVEGAAVAFVADKAAAGAETPAPDAAGADEQELAPAEDKRGVDTEKSGVGERKSAERGDAQTQASARGAEEPTTRDRGSDSAAGTRAEAGGRTNDASSGSRNAAVAGEAKSELVATDPAAEAPQERREGRSAERVGAEAGGAERLGVEAASRDAQSGGGQGQGQGQGQSQNAQQHMASATGAAAGAESAEAPLFDAELGEPALAQPGLSVAATRVDAAAGSISPQAAAAVRGGPVGEQISAAILSRGDDRRIVVQLDPAELGRVSIELTFADDAVSVSVRAERQDALDLMRRSADELERQLRDAGIEFDNLSFASEGGREGGFGQSGEDAARDGFAFRGAARLEAENAAALQSAANATRNNGGWETGVDLRV